MKLYAISDVHGCFAEFKKTVEELNIIEQLKNKTAKLILLGDYIDGGINSFKTLEYIYNLQNEFGNENVIALKGNHEQWFLDFLSKEEFVWLEGDKGFLTTESFLTEEQSADLRKKLVTNDSFEICDFIIDTINENHKELINWLKNLPLYYETNTQIFVHAGVDEEAGDMWKWGTPDYVFMGKFPMTFGKFYKDIIAGHISTETISGKKGFNKIYFDGDSHYFIDGSVLKTKTTQVLCYDDVDKKYYNVTKDGIEEL